MAGPAHPGWKDGRYSKTLPKRLMAAAQASLADPDRLAMAEELAVVDARIGDMLQRVDTGESGRLWQQLRATWVLYQKALRANNAPAEAAALLEHGDLVIRGHDDYASWADVLDLIHRRQRLAESERKRLIESQQTISSEQALAMMGQLIDAVQAHVQNPATLQAIVSEFVRLTGRPDPGQSLDC